MLNITVISGQVTLSKRFISIFLLSILNSCGLFDKQEEKALQDPEEQPLVWKVKGGKLKPPLYLMAHQYPNARSFLRHGRTFSDLVQKVDTILIPFDQPENRVYRDVAITTKMADTLVLDSAITESARKALRSALRRIRRVDAEAIQKAPPLAVAELVIPALREARDNPTYARKAWKLRKKTYKPALGALKQSSLKEGFKKISYDSQVKALQTVLTSQKRIKRGLYDMARAYEIPNYKALHKARTQAYPFPKTYQTHIINPGTEKWLEKIKALTGNNEILALVGAEHLQGESGLLKRLKKAGYDLTPYELEIFEDPPPGSDEEAN